MYDSVHDDVQGVGGRRGDNVALRHCNDQQ